MTKNTDQYDKWFEEFQQFLKEGLMSDEQNKEQLLKLMRYNSNFTDGMVSLDDYVKHMKEG